MAEFTPINSQEELDALIKDRLDRKEQSIRSEYTEAEEWKKKAEDYDHRVKDYDDQLTTLRQEIADKDTSIADLTGKIKAYETDSVKNRIAAEAGLPADFASRLKGETEKDWREDAENLSGLFRKTYPSKSTVESVEKESIPLKAMLKHLRGEE